MISVRLVVDTNIIVSAALKPDGLQRTVLLLAITKPASLYVTEEIIAEYRDVLSRAELKIRKGLRQPSTITTAYSEPRTPGQTVTPASGHE
jgi:predicted nucleic acid-binding protein